MTHKIAANGVSDCVESYRYRMKKSIFIELSFLAFLLVPWQIALNSLSSGFCVCVGITQSTTTLLLFLR